MFGRLLKSCVTRPFISKRAALALSVPLTAYAMTVVKARAAEQLPSAEEEADTVEFKDLLKGYRRFYESGWAKQRARWSVLANGQSPQVLVIACSDSRVDPGQIFDAGPGEVFIVRNVANLVPPYEDDQATHGVSAALEFAVTQLQVKEIVVLGHRFCGGCAAALTKKFANSPNGEGGFISRWISLLDAPRDRVRAKYPSLSEAQLPAQAFEDMEYECIRESLHNLRTFPWVAEREKAGTLKLHGACFRLTDGKLNVLNEEQNEFKAVTPCHCDHHH